MSGKEAVSEHVEGLESSSPEVTEKTRNNDTFATVIQHSKPNPWSRGYLRLYFMCLLVYLCATMAGFDGQLMGSINAMKSYTEHYGLPAEGSSGTGLVFSIFSPTLGAFIGGRFILAFFSSFACVAAPMYLLEVAPPQYRATVSGMYNTLYYFGAIIVTCTVYATNHHLTGLVSWRLPLWLQMLMLCPGLVCLGIWLVPESPRWLVGKDRHEEARKILADLHADGDHKHPLVELQMTEIVQALKQEGMMTWRYFFDLRVLFKTRARRYRIMLNIAFSWFGQFSGNNIASYYLPYLVANVGITNTSTQLLLNIVYAITDWTPAMIGARLHDVFGRRKMLTGVTLEMADCLAITAGTAADYVHTGSKASSRASITFIYVFGSTFALAMTSMQPIYPGEVLSNDMRAKGMEAYSFTAATASFVNTIAAPVWLRDTKYWMYVFFVFWDIFECVFIYFFFVETKGRTLEELDEIHSC
ncbi:uncharacterized protein MYCFIDRAFT_63887 [Pseudocercospora fijiensis CIRAD86]|uniref:Major facilitator superfamily (MFS) profile domain-containing protein n=1 Tax=Pseudocercospora fijiensis (strain CIRAD86) TaxID=383855 RepID=M2YK33_PSEFD|nr:uncharacterized protein MYCFIDRAFT_63887 [Pseudocercospora fijiensis CIRAD86]EME78125.1 hypothetical protein MYCFIDRAFT_63887 [Pseudocercospora fijiensis CIRAD86]